MLKLLSAIAGAIILFFAFSSSLSCIRDCTNDIIAAGEKVNGTIDKIEDTAQQIEDEYNNIVDTFNEKTEEFNGFVDSIGLNK